MIVRIRRSTRKRVRPTGPVRADIITRLCVFPVPPRTCDDIRTMTTRTKITHFSTVARPLEPRYFKNASYFRVEWRDHCLVTDYSTNRMEYEFLFSRERPHMKKTKCKELQKSIFIAMQRNITLNNYSPVKMR